MSSQVFIQGYASPRFYLVVVFLSFFQVNLATNQIVMNCADIDIITASFVPEGGEGEGEILSIVFSYFS